MEFFASGSALYRLQSPFFASGSALYRLQSHFLPPGVLCSVCKATFLPPGVLCIVYKAPFLPPGMLCSDYKATFLPPGVLCIDYKAHHRLHPFPYTLYIYTRARGGLLRQVEHDAFHSFAAEIISTRQQTNRRGGSALPGDFTYSCHTIFTIRPSRAEICNIPTSKASERHLNLCELLAGRCREGIAAGFHRFELDASRRRISFIPPPGYYLFGISTQRDALPLI